MLTAEEAAKLLGISKRTIYELAAPAGPIPCYRMGRTVRFERTDLDEYAKSCRYTSTKTSHVGVLNLTASSPEGESGLLKLFRKAGLDPKRKPTSKKKRRDFSHLQLVAKPSGAQ